MPGGATCDDQAILPPLEIRHSEHGYYVTSPDYHGMNVYVQHWLDIPSEVATAIREIQQMRFPRAVK